MKVTAADSHGGTLGINVCEVLHHGPLAAQARRQPALELSAA